ncbi:MAG: ROK family transcriptional regulator [Hungatella hathewayi]|nr:ROK family transcriptional regulator [Hungatella hathewayi]
MKMKRNSMQLLKAAIYKYGPTSRSRLAELLEVTPPTITNNISALMAEGLVEEMSSAGSKCLGRKPIDVDYIANARHVLGIELGPYFTILVICDLKGQVVLKKKCDIAPMEYEKMLTAVSGWIGELIQESSIPVDSFIGIGVAVPGFIESDSGTIRQCYRASWNGKNMSKDLSGLLDLPVILVNNAQARAIHVDLLDASVTTDMFAYFYVSHGIACPLIIKNGLLSSEILGAGEVGHMTMDQNGRQCDVCGKLGCLEAYASERAISKRCQEAMELGVSTALQDLSPDASHFNIKDILKAQALGDQLACRVMNDAIMYLGLAMANIINFISPPLFIIDSYMLKPEQNRRQLLAVISKNVYSFSNNDIDIRFIEYDSYTSAVGAAAHALERFFIDL